MAINLRRILEQMMGPGAADGRGFGSPGGSDGRGHGGPGGMGGATGRSDGGMGALGGIFGGLGGGGTGGGLGDILGRLGAPSTGRQAAAAGGLLGAVLGGGLMRTGGMAVLGLLAHRAYTQWQAQQAGAAPVPPEAEFAQPEAADSVGRPFGLALIRAMVAAGRADGALDAAERERIFAEAERLELSDEERGEIFALLDTPADPRAIAALAATEAQGAELYLASAMAMGTGQSASERAYLGALASALRLPPELRARLDAQLREADGGAA